MTDPETYFAARGAGPQPWIGIGEPQRGAPASKPKVKATIHAARASDPWHGLCGAKADLLRRHEGRETRGIKYEEPLDGPRCTHCEAIVRRAVD